MAKRRFQLTEEQVQELGSAHDEETYGPMRARYLAVRLYGSGYPTDRVLAMARCSHPSLMCWCRKYRARGITGLVDRRVGGNRARLTRAQVEELKVRMRRFTRTDSLGAQDATEDGRFWTIEDLRRALDTWYGVRYQSPASYHRLLAIYGSGYQR